jgi:hypothetical protein
MSVIIYIVWRFSRNGRMSKYECFIINICDEKTAVSVYFQEKGAHWLQDT